MSSSVPVRPFRFAVAAIVALAVTLVMSLPAPGSATESGDPPTQYPFACTAQDHRLELIVDNQDGEGVEVTDDDGNVLGYSRDCDAETRTWYYGVDTNGELHVIRDHGDGPIDDIDAAMGDATLATTTLTDGREVPYLIRHERGVINRFIYSTSMLTTAEEVTSGSPADPDRSNWNGRLLFQFQGGVGIGHSQGRYDDRGTRARAIKGEPDMLGTGDAVLYSTATSTEDHYNLMLGGRTAVMVKDHFVGTHGEPEYTVSLGGSGGGIQQYVYAQNHPDLLDALVPQYSYPDMTTQTIHVGDCALLDRWMDLEAEDAAHWQDWDTRSKLQGLNSIEGYLGDNAEGLNEAKQLLAQVGVDLPQQTGSSECLEGWLGLAALAMNPEFGDETNWDLLGDRADEIEATHWDDVREVYGTDPETGFARVPWDNVGVQYGLQSVSAGDITPQQFLEVNSEVGSWKNPDEMVAEGVPFEDLNTVVARVAADRGITPDEVLGGVASGAIPYTEIFDPWSARNSNLAEGSAPAPRRSGDLTAIENAYSSGLVFRGGLEREIPIIDVRPYLEGVLDMHNSHQSFATRQRLIDASGDAGAQKIWFIGADEDGGTPAEEDVNRAALTAIDQWLTNLDADPSLSVSEAAPDAATDRCFEPDGTQIAAGEGVWAGILDGAADGACTSAFPVHSTSRIEAGAPITGDIYKCRVMPVETAVADGVYGGWEPAKGQVDRLTEIFPTGVCDYDLPSVADPDADVPGAPHAKASGPDSVKARGVPGATMELRAAGDVVGTMAVGRSGKVRFTGLEPGTYVLRQVIDAQPGDRTSPVTVG